MSNYKIGRKDNWIGRSSSGQELYLNEKIQFSSIKLPFQSNPNKTIALLGYSSDEGVRRNHGRVGSSLGPDAIRKQLGKMQFLLYLVVVTTLHMDITKACLNTYQKAKQ